MAIVEFTCLINRIIGKINSSVFSTYRGTSYIRSLPSSFHSPNTTRQQHIKSNIMKDEKFEKTKQLILLAPFLATPMLQIDKTSPISIPTIIFHGKYDEIAQYQVSRERAYQLFTNLEFNSTEDHHDLNKTITTLNWNKFIT